MIRLVEGEPSLTNFQQRLRKQFEVRREGKESHGVLDELKEILAAHEDIRRGKEVEARRRDLNRRFMIRLRPEKTVGKFIFDFDATFGKDVAYLTANWFVGKKIDSLREEDEIDEHNRILHIAQNDQIGVIEFFNVNEQGIDLTGLSEQATVCNTITKVNPDLDVKTDPPKST